MAAGAARIASQNRGRLEIRRGRPAGRCRGEAAEEVRSGARRSEWTPREGGSRIKDSAGQTRGRDLCELQISR